MTDNLKFGLTLFYTFFFCLVLGMLFMMKLIEVAL
jgi:hypothetical protein